MFVCRLHIVSIIHVCVMLLWVPVNMTITRVDDPKNGRTLLGTLDYAWLFSYAIAMFIR